MGMKMGSQGMEDMGCYLSVPKGNLNAGDRGALR